MAAGRKCKVGLDYFELDCRIDEKVKLIRAEYGLKGFAVVVMMYQHIYGGDHGYYCEWDEERLLLFMSDNGLIGESKNLIGEVVQACIRRGIFSGDLYKRYGILTSHGVQEQYLRATAKRESIELKKEYLLISIPKNRSNVAINSISGGGNVIPYARNEQSRVEKSRAEDKNTVRRAEAHALFEELWGMYPVKKGKGKVSEAAKLRLLDAGREVVLRALRRYMDYVGSVGYLHYQNGSTFFTSGYIDYLDANYAPDRKKAGQQAGQFGEFMHQDYDFEQIEREILSN